MEVPSPIIGQLGSNQCLRSSQAGAIMGVTAAEPSVNKESPVWPEKAGDEGYDRLGV